jgi:hypothetical protein
MTIFNHNQAEKLKLSDWYINFLEWPYSPDAEKSIRLSSTCS